MRKTTRAFSGRNRWSGRRENSDFCYLEVLVLSGLGFRARKVLKFDV